ncbi:bifunctional enoyl-CoA hydratase/phosphate acetyltransferase [Zavarzinia sp. CC-PAN008]|uniref:bifunctional enoyl-CoA hydratase/phosphate acetyltransferase n=1 Tax=Zavarzinia sp. CC-PAN008 TaxID=3243332 RepID=UPI003F7433B8
MADSEIMPVAAKAVLGEPAGQPALAERGARHRLLVERAKAGAPLVTAIVHPTDANSLGGALDAAAAGLITPVLVGPEGKIRDAALKAGLDLAGCRLVDAAHSHAAAEEAVRLARVGEVQAIMKGNLHTDELMEAIVAKEGGLRTNRRLSHIFVMDVPTYPRLLLITDAAICIQPTLEEKRDIVQNAIDLAHAIGIPEPKVAILSAVETVTPKLPSTVDAAALCKMADRQQIVGGVLDGPLAFDNAISAEAARTKGITSPVAGSPDILLCPDLISGNMIAKQLSYLANADSGGVVLGAKVPIMLTSRADDAQARLVSAALAVLKARAPAAMKPKT